MLGLALQVGLLALVVAIVFVILTNAFYMLISPKNWFELPKWIGLHGILTKERYAKGWGALEVRLLGVLTIATVSFVAADRLGRRVDSLTPDRLRKMELWLVFLVVSAPMLTNAFCMLLSPVSWFRLPGWLRFGGRLSEKHFLGSRGALRLRLLAAMILVVVGSIAYEMLTQK